MEVSTGASRTTRWPKALVSLRHRNYRLFWMGQMISLMGTWMQNMAQGWLVLQLTNSPFLLGLVNAITFTPPLLLSLFAGVVADRYPKRKVIIATQISLMLLAFVLGLLVITGLVRYWHVLILAGLLGIVNSFDIPTRQAFVVEMVGKEDLMNAIALNSSIFNAARVVGPAIAGLAIGGLGIAACFLLNGASFIAVIAGLLFIKVPEYQPVAVADKRVKANILEGLRYIMHTRVILHSMIMLALLSVFTINFNVLIPVLARDNLGQQAAGYGLLMSSLGIGAFVGALILAWLSGKGPQRKVLYAGAIGLSVFELLLSTTRSFPVAVIFLTLTGWALVTFSASVNTTIQLNVPDHLRGRVMSVYFIFFTGLMPAGSLLSGSLAHLWGAPASLAMGAIGGLASIATIFFLDYRAMRKGPELKI